MGIVEPSSLAGLCRTALEHGVTTTTIGFGVGYDEHLLRAMADAGGGNMYYIETPDQAPAVFAEEIEGLLSLAAQNITVEIRTGSAVELTTVYHNYPTRSTPGGLQLQVGDLYAREPKLVLVEFLVPDPLEVDGAIAECIVIANVLTSSGGVERQELHLPITHSLSRAGHHEPEIRREMLLLGAARAREAALKAQAEGDYEAAQGHLRAARSSFDAPGAPPLDGLLKEEIQDLEAMEARMDPTVFGAADAKYLNQRAYDSRRSSRSSSQRISRARSGAPGIRYREGDASRPTGSGAKILAFVVNDQGAWGKGFVMTVSDRWPTVKDQYLSWHAGDLPDAATFALGSILLMQVEAGLWVAPLLVQEGLRPVGGRPPVRYPAIERALQTLAVEATQLGASIHMPRTGTGLAGGDWRRVEPLIKRYLVGTGVSVTVYDRAPSHSTHT